MSQRESLSRWLRTTEQEKRALDARRVVSGLARTGQVSRSTVMLAEEDVAIEDALSSGVDAEANIEMTDENLDLSDDATDAISDFQDDTDWMGEEEFESRADDSEEMINLYQNLDEAEQQRLADKAELEEKFADFEGDMSDASGRIDAARDRANEAFGKAESADSKAVAADEKASSAQSAADTATSASTAANQKALEALGLASTGKVWVQDTAPTFSDRPPNLFVNPSFELDPVPAGGVASSDWAAAGSRSFRVLPVVGGYGTLPYGAHAYGGA